MCTGVASCKDKENKEAKMKKDEDVKEEEKAGGERSEEALPPLGATVPGREGGFPHDPEYLYAG